MVSGMGKLLPSPRGRVHGSPMGGTTGVSLEQGLGLGGISRGRPGRRPGGECSSVPDYYFIINKINPSSQGPGSPVPGFLEPGGSRNHLFSSNLLCQEKQIFLAL